MITRRILRRNFSHRMKIVAGAKPEVTLEEPRVEDLEFEALGEAFERKHVITEANGTLYRTFLGPIHSLWQAGAMEALHPVRISFLTFTDAYDP